MIGDLVEVQVNRRTSIVSLDTFIITAIPMVFYVFRLLHVLIPIRFRSIHSLVPWVVYRNKNTGIFYMPIMSLLFLEGFLKGRDIVV